MQSQRKLLILQNISLKENFCNFLWLFHNIFTPDHMRNRFRNVAEPSKPERRSAPKRALI